MVVAKQQTSHVRDSHESQSKQPFTSEKPQIIGTPVAVVEQKPKVVAGVIVECQPCVHSPGVQKDTH